MCEWRKKGEAYNPMNTVPLPGIRMMVQTSCYRDALSQGTGNPVMVRSIPIS